MKAFEIRKPGDYGIIDAPIPEITDQEVLLKVGYAAVCHSDIDMIDGHRKHLISYPNIGGHEFAGSIAKVGALVKGFNQGDTVCVECMILCRHCAKCDMGSSQCENYSELGFMRGGGYSEYVAVPATNCHKFTKMKMEQAALVEPLGNGFAIAEAAGIRPGETVVVIGPGPIGLYALDCAKLYHPGKTIMLGTRWERLKFAEGTADELVNINETDSYKKVMELTGGKGADVILMCATTVSACEIAMKIAGTDCRIMIEGVPYGDVVPVDFSQFVIRSLTVKGVAGVTSMQFRKVINLIESGYLDPTKYVTHHLRLEDIVSGFDLIKSKRDGVVKILLKP